jgi:hypothetical protein
MAMGSVQPQRRTLATALPSTQYKAQQRRQPLAPPPARQAFAKENARMEMAGEMMGDAVDSALGGEDEEDEVDDMVSHERAIHTWRAPSAADTAVC